MRLKYFGAINDINEKVISYWKSDHSNFDSYYAVHSGANACSKVYFFVPTCTLHMAKNLCSKQM